MADRAVTDGQAGLRPIAHDHRGCRRAAPTSWPSVLAGARRPDPWPSAHLLFEHTDGAAPPPGRECESQWTIGRFGVSACIPRSLSCSQAPHIHRLPTATRVRTCASSRHLRGPTLEPRLSASISWESTLGVICLWSSTPIDAGPTPLLPSTEMTGAKASTCGSRGPRFRSFRGQPRGGCRHLPARTRNTPVASVVRASQPPELWGTLAANRKRW
jgi:hypothetical protein